MYYCYLLRSLSSNKTYFGYTTNLHRRLLQHNGHLSGGAKYTTSGRPWSLVCYISGFPDKKSALQFEWRNHHPPIKRSGLSGRIISLSDILFLSHWTSSSPISSSFSLSIFWLEPLKLPSCPPYCFQYSLYS